MANPSGYWNVIGFEKGDKTLEFSLIFTFVVELFKVVRPKYLTNIANTSLIERMPIPFGNVGPPCIREKKCLALDADKKRSYWICRSIGLILKASLHTLVPQLIEENFVVAEKPAATVLLDWVHRTMCG